MSNLQNIKEKIIKDAENEAKNLVMKAEEKRARLLEEEREKTEREVAFIIERAEREAKLIKEQKISSAKIEARDLVLRAKGEVIDRVVQRILEKLTSLDDEQYLQFVMNRLEGQDFSEEALLIVPKDKQALMKAQSLPLSLDEEGTVQSGFKIQEGRIIRNQSFASIIEHHRDELQLQIAQELFHE